MQRTICLALVAIAWLSISCQLRAEVKQTADDGFLIETVQETDLDSPQAYARMVDEFGAWWGGDHSYTGDGKNLTLDLQRRCMFEQLPDGGFVRHMEIALHQPGKKMVLRGGLGPLQELGISGALTYQFTTLDSGKTQIKLTYHVHGPSYLRLAALAPAVDQVLTGQLEKLNQHLAAKR
jgi:uncharacterized protein YndB with AHSA1/START domain